MQFLYHWIVRPTHCLRRKLGYFSTWSCDATSAATASDNPSLSDKLISLPCDLCITSLRGFATKTTSGKRGDKGRRRSTTSQSSFARVTIHDLMSGYVKSQFHGDAGAESSWDKTAGTLSSSQPEIIFAIAPSRGYHEYFARFWRGSELKKNG